MSDTAKTAISYKEAEAGYFEKRGLKRHAGVWSLWALGVGAVISGHFSGWNIGLAVGGWGGMFIATIIIMIMFLGLVFSIAEMSPALPHTGGAYSFARTAMGPWGGFLTGLAENVEYVLTPAVIVFFISTYLSQIFATPVEFLPAYWLIAYGFFVALNIRGVAFSFQVTVFVTVAALTCLVVFWISALSKFDFSVAALNIDRDGALLVNGGGPLLPFGFAGALAALPFAVWLFLAIEQLPLAAEESLTPQRDIPRGIIAGMLTLILSAFLILFLNPGIVGVGSWALGQSAEPLLDGFRAVYGLGTAKLLALIAVVGLVASFHTIIFAEGRQIYSLSRAGYFPTFLSLTHGERKTPHVAMISGAVLGISVMLLVWLFVGSERGTAIIGGTLLNMAVFGAMFSYIMQAVSFILLRRNQPDIDRPYRSPLGQAGACLTIVIAITTLGFQLSDETYRIGVIGVAAWFLLGAGYFHFFRRHRLVLSPEEKFALQQNSTT